MHAGRAPERTWRSLNARAVLDARGAAASPRPRHPRHHRRGTAARNHPRRCTLRRLTAERPSSPLSSGRGARRRRLPQRREDPSPQCKVRRGPAELALPASTGSDTSSAFFPPHPTRLGASRWGPLAPPPGSAPISKCRTPSRLAGGGGLEAKELAQAFAYDDAHAIAVLAERARQALEVGLLAERL